MTPKAMMPIKIGSQIENANVCGTSQFSVKSEKSLGLRAPLRKTPKEEKIQIRGVASKMRICRTMSPGRDEFCAVILCLRFTHENVAKNITKAYICDTDIIQAIRNDNRKVAHANPNRLQRY